MNLIRENALAVWDELYGVYWWCRCKAAANAALVAAAILEYCRWRGKRAFVAMWFARRMLGLARRLVPAPLKPLTEAVCGE